MKLFLFILVSILFLSSSVFATEDALKKVKFNYEQSGTTYQLARVALRDILLPIEQEINRKLLLFTAKQDLNGDKTPEIIARIADKKFFCSDDIGCDTHIFAISSDGPKKIGFFQSAEVLISEKDRSAVKSLFIKTQYNDYVEYVWNGESYIKKVSEG